MVALAVNLGDYIQWVPLALAVAAAAWMGVRSADRKILQERLTEERQNGANERQKREALEVEFDKFKASAKAELATVKADAAAEIATLTADRDALQRVVTGEVHWVALGQHLDEFEERAVEHWTGQKAAVRDVKKVVDRIASALEEERP